MENKIKISYIDKETNEKIAPDEEIQYTPKIIEGYELNEDQKNNPIELLYSQSSYTIDLNLYRIKNNGTMQKETSIGINSALQYVKDCGKFKKVIFPKGTYLIDENNPIIIDFKNIILDLNGATLQINTNGLPKYSIVKFVDGAEGVILTNGTVRGDRDTHDYKTVSGSHEWGCGIVFSGGLNSEVNNITVTNVTGYGITTESGNGINRFYAVAIKDIESGAINSKGEVVADKTKTRTKAYDVSVCVGEFELGYTLGYQGYPYLYNKQYTAYFYDLNNKFISSKECIQFRKVEIPSGAKYVRFVFPQAVVTSNLGYAAWISNFKPPTNIVMRNCNINNNRTLGIGFCGGQQWLIENNIFDKNGGNSPGYAIDFEDGWELMQDITVKGNTFTNNVSGDIVTCAGDNIVFQDNNFTKLVYMWERTTNYKFYNNIFNGPVTYRYSSNLECSGNEYINSTFNAAFVQKQGEQNVMYVHDEKFNNTSIDSTGSDKIVNSQIFNTTGQSLRLCGVIEGCNINVKGGYLRGSLNKCNILDTTMAAQLSPKITNSTIKNSQITTHGNTESITIMNSTIANSNILMQTWGSQTILDIENNKIDMNTRNDAFISITAGKSKNIIFKNNIVNNTISKPVFNMFDTTYSMPNGNATIIGNTITQTNFDYVFSGTTIKQGVFNVSETLNLITGATMFNPIYLNNPYLLIKNS